MEQITINIKSGLSPEQEVLEIAKHLGKKFLPVRQKAIGPGYEVSHLQTKIVVNRLPIEKTSVLQSCPICGAEFTRSAGYRVFTNFGGTTKKRWLCSEDCRGRYMAISPGRITIKSPSYMMFQ